MSKILGKLERKFGKYAINNLIIYVLGAYGVGYILTLIAPDVYEYLTREFDS